MPEIIIEVNATAAKREIDGEEETVYSIQASGVKTLDLSLTPTEFQWKTEELRADYKRLRGEIARDLSPLNPKNVRSLRAELKDVRQIRVLLPAIRALIPGGDLAG